jgi:hypothetical protein
MPLKGYACFYNIGKWEGEREGNIYIYDQKENGHMEEILNDLFFLVN